MPPKEGYYRLRVLPDSGVEGIFATAGDVDSPIQIAPAVPHLTRMQTWILRPSENMNDTWYIATSVFPGTRQLGFGYTDIQLGMPLKLSPELKAFRLEDRGESQFSITADTHMVGMTWVVSASSEDVRIIQLKPIPMGVPVHTMPTWLLELVED